MQFSFFFRPFLIGFSLVVSLTLGACGGGSGGTPDSSGVSNDITKIFSTLDYRQSATTTQSVYEVFVTVNKPAVLSPNRSALPAGAQPQFSAVGLPAGLTIDSATGVISGTPTSVNGSKVFVTMTVVGFQGSVGTEFTLYVQEAAPPPTVWTRLTANAGFPSLTQYTTAALGNSLFLVGPRYDNLAIETWRSDDQGSTWRKLGGSPSIAVKDFALASDGVALYIAGGVNATKVATNQMWRFDGATWSQIATRTPFTARWGHTLTRFANKWVVVGGASYETASGSTVNNLNDVWESADNGVNWSNTVPKSAANRDVSRTGHCAVVINDTLFLVGGTVLGSEWTDGFTSPRAKVSASGDGVKWSTLVFGTSSYSFSSCGAIDGKIVQIGGALVDAQGLVPVGYVSNREVIIFSNLAGTVKTQLTEQTQANGNTAFDRRYANGLVKLNSQWLVVGGRSPTRAPAGPLVLNDPAFLTDVWVSNLTSNP